MIAFDGMDTQSEIVIPLADGMSFKLPRSAPNARGYPTAALQRGLLLHHGGRDLAEEGVGFGVPILQCGLQTLFPGAVEITRLRQGAVWDVDVVFTMNLVERFARRGNGRLQSRWLYVVKDLLGAVHRRVPPVRELLTAASNALRWALGWRTTFEDAGVAVKVSIDYAVDCQEARLATVVDTTSMSGQGITNVVVMNEQGACFDRYRDSSGVHLQGRHIGTWQEVAAAQASFLDVGHGVTFGLRQVAGARLFRGRELVGSRLAWAGFGYVLPPTMGRLAYELRLKRLA